MQVSKQLLRTLPASGISYVLASAKEAVNLVGAAQAGLAIGIGEVPALPADPTLDYMKRLRSAHLVLERMEVVLGLMR